MPVPMEHCFVYPIYSTAPCSVFGNRDRRATGETGAIREIVENPASRGKMVKIQKCRGRKARKERRGMMDYRGMMAGMEKTDAMGLTERMALTDATEKTARAARLAMCLRLARMN